MKKEITVEIIGFWFDAQTLEIKATLQLELAPHQRLSTELNISELLSMRKQKKK